MWSHKTIFMLCLLIVAIGQPASARTWRPSGQPPLKGEFEDVVGSNVLIRTDAGVKTVAYADLSLTDKAVVKSKLVALDRETQAILLDRGPASFGEPISSPDSEPPGHTDPVPGESENDDLNRTWTDIAGNRIVAELVGVQGTIVLLRSDGNVQQYPMKGFCAADQAWIAEHQTQVVPRMPPGHPSPGVAPPGFPSPGFPPHGISMAPPVIPILVPDEPIVPPLDGPSFGGGDFSGIKTPPATDGGSVSPPSSNDFSVIPPMFIPHPMPQLPMPSPPSSGIGHNTVSTADFFRCEHCGAEFAPESGIKEGDACPKCSGGSNYSGSWVRSLRFSRGLVKLAILLVVCTGSGIVWLVRTIVGSSD